MKRRKAPPKMNPRDRPVKLQVQLPLWLARRLRQEARHSDGSLNAEMVARLMGSLIRRGPDDYGLWSWSAWAERAVREGYRGQRPPQPEKRALVILENAVHMLEQVEKRYSRQQTAPQNGYMPENQLFAVDDS